MAECFVEAFDEDYVDYLIEYTGERELVESLYGEDGCVIFVNDRFAVTYRRKPDDYMESFSRMEYTNFPKLYGLMDTSSAEAVGAVNVKRENVLGLTGKDVIIGIVDTGIDIRNDLFRSTGGKTRIIAAWDQSVQGKTNSTMGYGMEYTKEQIDEALASDEEILTDENGHGTFLAGVACGGETQDFTGVAPEASIIVVKLKKAKENLKSLYGVPEGAVAYQENDIMTGISYLLKQSSAFKKNISILLGVGSNSGSHTGASSLESYINNVALLKGVAISVPAGNEGVAGHHFMGNISGNEQYSEMEINVTNNDNFTLEIWGSVPNTYSVAFEIPGGEFVSRISPRFDKSEIIRPVFGGGTIYVDYFLVEDESGEQLIMMRFFNPPNGLWRIRVYGTGDSGKIFNAWLPISEFLSDETRFIRPTPEITITNPGTGMYPMCASAYDHYNDSLFIDASRGYTADGFIKPDFAAPGVDVYGPGRADTFVRKSGSSIAAAHSSGCAALILEWVNGREETRFLNGNQIRNYFIRGALRPGSDSAPLENVINGDGIYTYVREYPNREWGYGILNIYEVFNRLRSS